MAWFERRISGHKSDQVSCKIMFTLFDAVQVGTAVMGAIAGYTVGVDHFGMLAGVGLAVVGLGFGWIVGSIPYVAILQLTLLPIRFGSVAKLRSRLENEPFVSHLIIAELVKRGEPPSSFEGIIAKQLESKSPLIQEWGIRNARMWLPNLLIRHPGSRTSERNDGDQ